MQGSLPRYNAYGALIRSSIATDSNEKMRCAEFAQTAADQCNDGLLRILARVTLSYLDPAQHARYLQESLAIAQTIESRELTAALAALVVDPQGHAGMLEPLAHRHRQTPVERLHAPLSIA